MKTLFNIGVVILLSLKFTYSQNPELWGTTLNGGQYGGGTIFKINGDGTGFSSKYSFQYNYSPSCDLYEAADSSLYGMTNGGGTNYAGTIFKIDPVTNIKTELYSFMNATGKYPNGNLIQLNNGLFYGMTSAGGNFDLGVIFSFNPINSTYIVLYDFNLLNGSSPYGSLLKASNGKLYGMTSVGGQFNSGVLFSFDVSTNTYTDLISFDGINGNMPNGNLIEAVNGKLYGTTTVGGAYYSGNIFSYDISNNNCTDLFDFIDTLGRGPNGCLIQALNGKLYGMTQQGGLYYGGVIFSYDLTGNIYNDLYDFDADGNLPLGNLFQSANGIFYGLTYYGGTNNVGVLFSFDNTNNTYTKLVDLAPSIAAKPSASLIHAKNGKLYGMSSGGGSNNSGAIFNYDLNTCNNVYSFPGTTGSWPQYNFIQANNGKLYGMTPIGGSNNNGALYCYDPISNLYSVLFDFDSSHGTSPLGGLIQANNGLLYGMTEYGGINNGGVIFNYNISTNSYTVLYHFIDSTGANPFTSSLIQLNNGKLYGTTYFGGSNGYGVIFSFDPVNNTYTDLYHFDGIHGRNARASLMQASNGNLYGVARGGVNNYGVIFSFNLNVNSYFDEYDFIDSTGSSPHSSLLQLANGKMYGTTSFGGLNGYGVIYSFDPVNHIYTDIIDLDSTKGIIPFRNLMLASNGKIYGTTSEGGNNNGGVLFSFDPSNNSYTKTLDFDNINGMGPLDVLQFDLSLGINNLSNDDEIQLYPSPMNSISILQLNQKVKDADVIIVDMNGKEILNQKLTSDRMEIKREDFKSGTYLVKVIEGKKQYLKKLIIQ